MTIALGLQCVDAIVLSADRQMTAPGAYKYQESKIEVFEGDTYLVGCVYSGFPRPWKELAESLSLALHHHAAENEVTNNSLRKIVKDVLARAGKLDRRGRWLQMLVAIRSRPSAEPGFLRKSENPQLLYFDSKVLEEAENFNCLGVGDSPLVRYLHSELHAPWIEGSDLMPAVLGVPLSVHLIRQAKDYIPECGGKTDVVVFPTLGWGAKWLSDEVVERIETKTQQAQRETFGRFSEILKGLKYT